MVLPRVDKVVTQNGVNWWRYVPLNGGQLAIVVAKVTNTDHCGQSTAYVMPYKFVMFLNILPEHPGSCLPFPLP